MEKINIYFQTVTRGFFQHLFRADISNISFSGKKQYEVANRFHKLLSIIVRSKFADVLGVIQVVNAKNINNISINGSFNRFLNTELPYFIYLENPTALYHYSIYRKSTFLGKQALKKNLQSYNLNKIICMSKACQIGMNRILRELNVSVDTEVVYPLVPDNKYIDVNKIIKRSSSFHFNVLFATQGIRFISKGGLEVVKVAEKLSGTNIIFTILTESKYIPESVKTRIDKLDNIQLIEFGYTFEQMQQLYAKQNLLLHLTSDDSFGLVILEALKSGIPVISTNLYAIPEMVKTGYNGYLYRPKWYFFDKDNKPNPKVWNHRKKTLYNIDIIDNDIVDFSVDHILELYKDRELLLQMSLNAFNTANEQPFSFSYIKHQWELSMKQIYEEK